MFPNLVKGVSVNFKGSENHRGLTQRKLHIGTTYSNS